MTIELYDAVNYQGEKEKRVRIYLESLDEGLEYVREHKYTGVTIGSESPRTRRTISLDFFEKIKGITSLDIAFLLSKKADISPIYQLSDLREMHTVPGHKLDMSQFPKLSSFFAQNLIDEVVDTGELTSVKRLLFYPKSTDLRMLEGMKSLQFIRMLYPKMESMRGVEKLPKLEEIVVRNASKLTNIDHLSLSSSITDVLVQSTKRLTDYSALTHNNSINHLGLFTPVESLSFVPRMTSLDSISFSEVIDGDLEPLLQSETLTNVSFQPQKGHYTHTVDQINEALQDR